MVIRFKLWKTDSPDLLWGYFDGSWWFWVGPNYPRKHACPKFKWSPMKSTHFNLDKYKWLSVPEQAGKNLSRRIIGDPDELNAIWGHKEVRLDPYSEYCYLCRIVDEMNNDNKATTDKELDWILERAYQQCEVANEVLSRNIDRKALVARQRILSLFGINQ